MFCIDREVRLGLLLYFDSFSVIVLLKFSLLGKIECG
jgi:hypothetical protein